MKRVVEAALRRHSALKSLEIWSGKRATTSRRAIFSSTCSCPELEVRCKILLVEAKVP